jgi:hypothetical protein
MKIHQQVQKLLRDTHTYRQTGDIKSPTTHLWRRRRERRNSSYSFSALDGGEWSASRPGPRFTPGKRTPGTHCTGAEWAPELVWTQRLEEKFSCLSRGSNLDSSVVQSVVRHYTAWATRLPHANISDVKQGIHQNTTRMFDCDRKLMRDAPDVRSSRKYTRRPGASVPDIISWSATAHAGCCGWHLSALLFLLQRDRCNGQSPAADVNINQESGAT